jgi:hypothetical protein
MGVIGLRLRLVMTASLMPETISSVFIARMSPSHSLQGELDAETNGRFELPSIRDLVVCEKSSAGQKVAQCGEIVSTSFARFWICPQSKELTIPKVLVNLARKFNLSSPRVA